MMTVCWPKQKIRLYNISIKIDDFKFSSFCCLLLKCCLKSKFFETVFFYVMSTGLHGLIEWFMITFIHKFFSPFVSIVKNPIFFFPLPNFHCPKIIAQFSVPVDEWIDFVSVIFLHDGKSVRELNSKIVNFLYAQIYEFIDVLASIFGHTPTHRFNKFSQKTNCITVESYRINCFFFVCIFISFIFSIVYLLTCHMHNFQT